MQEGYIFIDDDSNTGGRSRASRQSFSVSRSFNNLSSDYLPVGAMKNTSISPSPSNASLQFNPYSKSEILSTNGDNQRTPSKSPLSQRKGPVVKTIDKNAEPKIKEKKETAKNIMVKKTPKVTSSGEKASPIKKTSPVIGTKPKPGAQKHQEEKTDDRDIKGKGRVDKKAEESKRPDAKPKSRTNSVAAAGPKSPAVFKNKDKGKAGKMEVQGKKMKTPKMPTPLSDKEKFELLFDAYTKWGSDEMPADKGITAYQVTRWLKNVEILDGRKVCITMI